MKHFSFLVLVTFAAAFISGATALQTTAFSAEASSKKAFRAGKKYGGWDKVTTAQNGDGSSNNPVDVSDFRDAAKRMVASSTSSGSETGRSAPTCPRSEVTRGNIIPQSNIEYKLELILADHDFHVINRGMDLWKCYCAKTKLMDGCEEEGDARGSLPEPTMQELFDFVKWLKEGDTVAECGELGRTVAAPTFSDNLGEDKQFPQGLEGLNVRKVEYLKGQKGLDHEVSVDALGHVFLGQGSNKVAMDQSWLADATINGPEPGAIFAVRSKNDGKDTLRFGSGKVGVFHHSSLFSGKCVKTAGEITMRKLEDGTQVLRNIVNRSGHYHPSFMSLKNIVKFLFENGIEASAWCGDKGITCEDVANDIVSEANGPISPGSGGQGYSAEWNVAHTCVKMFPEVFGDSFCG